MSRRRSFGGASSGFIKQTAIIKKGYFERCSCKFPWKAVELVEPKLILAHERTLERKD
jgi:hypothetical protein